MICLSIANGSVQEVQELMSQFELVELRLDLLKWNSEQLTAVLQHSKNCILTCRQSAVFSEEKRKSLLATGLKLAPSYIDLDMNNNASFNEALITLSKKENVKLIMSYHNYDYTPPLPILKKYIEQQFFKGANISKIACKCSNQDELSRIFSLYYHYDNLLAIGMGGIAKVSRLAALDLGAPFSYVCSEKNTTAPGQLTKEDFISIRNILDE